MKNIVVVGAGFAGWATALYINKLFPNSNITVIGSTEIGILGAGEGTVPSIREFLRKVDIPFDDLIRECKATLKYGIRFDNWNKEGKGSYFNPFRALPHPDPQHELLGLEYDFVNLYCKLNDLEIDDYTILGANLRRNKVLYDDNLNELHSSAIRNAFHFDANEIAKYFKKVALNRNITYVDDIVTNFIQDDKGCIRTIELKNGSVTCDFVFDCTGFKKLIIGKLYNTKFISVKDRLPVDRAIPFFLPPKEEIEPYTIATAMSSGWSWQIPLQHRYGCGYVFDSTVCSDESAIEEVANRFGKDAVNIPRVFSFEAGYYEEIWKKNCIAIGLSGSFLEPLEATSIWFSLASLQILKGFISAMNNLDQFLIDRYNRKLRQTVEYITDHLQFHYLNKRGDTEFWRKINTAPRSEPMKNSIELWSHCLPETIGELIYPNSLVYFDQVGWMSVGNGIDFFDKTMLQKQFDSISHFYERFVQNPEKRKQDIMQETNRSISHRSYLEKIVGAEQLQINRKLIFK